MEEQANNIFLIILEEEWLFSIYLYEDTLSKEIIIVRPSIIQLWLMSLQWSLGAAMDDQK